MNNNIEFSWYKLINVKGLGPKSLLLIYRALAQKTISVEDIFELDETGFYSVFSDFGRGRFSRVKYENFHNIDEEELYEAFNQLEENGVKIIPLQDKTYPKLIKERLKVNSPPLLYCKGYQSLLTSRNISIVGSRDTESFALNLTKNISSVCANEGYNIVSGYAKGVDTNAHIGALEAGGTTTVVLPLGINHLSIKRDFKDLDWEKNTLFLSQFLPFEKWKARNAMARNKIVTALSDAVIVVSSGPEKDDKGRMSGTFDAAKSALDMGIPVFVVNPKMFANEPLGNKKLVSLGAVQIDCGSQIISFLFGEQKRVESMRGDYSFQSSSQLSLEM